MTEPERGRNEAERAKPGAKTVDLPELGHPLHIFIDTSIFHSLNFAFGNATLKSLVAAIQRGDVRLIVPEITRREVLAHLAKSVHEAKAAVGTYRKQAKILRNLPNHALAAVFAETDWASVQRALESGWEAFLTDASAIILPIDTADAAAVFEDYFVARAPFGGAGKKSEFPDGFVVRSLRSFAEKTKCKIAIVSQDSDFREACEVNLIWCPDLNTLVEFSAGSPPVKPEEVHALLKSFQTDINEKIVASFADRGFFWSSDEDHNADVEEVYDVEVEELDSHVLDVQDCWAEVAGTATIRFRANVRYPDPDMMYKDDETKEWISMGNTHVTLAADVSVPFSFSVDVGLLRKGDLDVEDVVINGNADIWFGDAEVEEVRREDYSQ